MVEEVHGEVRVEAAEVEGNRVRRLRLVREDRIERVGWEMVPLIEDGWGSSHNPFTSRQQKALLRAG